MGVRFWKDYLYFYTFAGVLLSTVLLFIPLRAAAQLPSSTATDRGFRLLFTSNWNVYSNISIQFNQTLPKEFNGYFITNGLGVFEIGKRQLEHAFDGFAKLVKIEFFGETKTGKFSAQFLQTNQWKSSVAKNDIVPYIMFESVEPAFSLLEKMDALLHGLDNMNVNIVRIGSTFLANNDFWRTYSFDPSTLATLNRIEPAVPGQFKGDLLSMLSSAHPLREYGTANYLTYVSTISPLPELVLSRLQIIRIVSPMERETVAEWRVPHPPYMHSFAVTKNFTILFGAPLYVNVAKMISTVEPFKSLEWLPDQTGNLFVVNHRTGGKLNPIPFSDGYFNMHHINAYEQADDEIIAYATAYKDLNFFFGLEMKTLLNNKTVNNIEIDSQIRRYTINLSKKTVQSAEVLCRPELWFFKNLELPTINEAYRYKKFCFFYGVSLKSDGQRLANITLGKKSVCDPRADGVWSRTNHYPAEPHFVSRVNAMSEDDGYLISLVLDGVTERTYVLILDAMTMTEVNHAYLPSALPYMLHGKYFF